MFASTALLVARCLACTRFPPLEPFVKRLRAGGCRFLRLSVLCKSYVCDLLECVACHPESIAPLASFRRSFGVADYLPLTSHLVSQALIASSGSLAPRALILIPTLGATCRCSNAQQCALSSKIFRQPLFDLLLSLFGLTYKLASRQQMSPCKKYRNDTWSSLLGSLESVGTSKTE